MAIGFIYIMTTSVEGLIKIGKSKEWKNRVDNLEKNGYYNVAGLKRYYVTRVKDYDEKEKLIHTIFSKSQVGTSELFALDKDLAKDMLEAFEGEQVYPEDKLALSEAKKATKTNIVKTSTTQIQSTMRNNNFWLLYQNRLNAKANPFGIGDAKKIIKTGVSTAVGTSDAWVGIFFDIKYNEGQFSIDFCCNDIDLFRNIKKYSKDIEKELGITLEWKERPFKRHQDKLQGQAKYVFNDVTIDNITEKDIDRSIELASKMKEQFKQYIKLCR